MPLPITLMYAGLLALFGMYLSARAGSYRGNSKISILYGDPVNMELAERVRVHQNFLEYVPIILILMGLIEATSGEAKMFGHPVPHRASRARIGFLPEAPYFYDYLTAREFLVFIGELCDLRRRDAKPFSPQEIGPHFGVQKRRILQANIVLEQPPTVQQAERQIGSRLTADAFGQQMFIAVR